MDNREADLDLLPDTREQDARELARLADELVDQIAAARRHYADLRAAIDGADTALATAPAVSAAPAPAVAPAAAPPAPQPDQQPNRESADGGYHRTPEEEAEIVALGMALNGGDRDEAHAHIVETFGIHDTEEILDRTFGSNRSLGIPLPIPRRRPFGRLRG